MKSCYKFFFFIGVCYTFFSFNKELQFQNEKEEIPYFTFYTLDKKPFVKDSLDTVRKKLFFYFNSECEHCQKQGKWLAKGIEKNEATFQELEIIFVSFEIMEEIEKFQKRFDFYQPNITLLQDSRLTFSNKFNVETFPSLLIYDKNGKLLAKFEGETKIEELLPYLK